MASSPETPTQSFAANGTLVSVGDSEMVTTGLRDALLAASTKGDDEEVKRLLDMGAQLDETDACTKVADHKFAVMGYSIRTEGWRYTRWMPWHGDHTDGARVAWDQPVGEELYDHRNDTGMTYFNSELHNLAVTLLEPNPQSPTLANAGSSTSFMHAQAPLPASHAAS